MWIVDLVQEAGRAGTGWIQQTKTLRMANRLGYWQRKVDSGGTTAASVSLKTIVMAKLWAMTRAAGCY
jgi:hypothetical protein